MGLEMFDKAQKDWEKLLTFQGLPNCQHLIPSMEEVRKEINLAKQQGTAVDSRVLWRKMYISNVEVFSRRHFHTAVLDQGSVIVFGGYTSLEPKEYVSGPSLLCRLKLGSKPGSTWEIIHATGTIPPQMAHHTAVTYERGMYVFGGIADPSVTRISQMYRLDLDTFEWTAPLYPGQLRAEISGHSAQVYKNEMIIFGGDLPDCGGNSNFTRIFNFETNKWSTITGKKLVPTRHEHMSWISDSKMYIFGGFGQLVDPYDGSALIWEETKSEVYAFDLEKKEWLPQPVDVQGPLAPRSQSQAACLAGKAVYLFGGIATTEYDLVTYYESGIRFSITDSGVSATGLTTSETVCPDARAGSTLTLDPENRRAILIGGYNAKRLCVFGDVWELSVTKRSKNEPDGGISICAFCGKENILRKCSGCKAVGYCNAECQKSGWKEHKKDCKK
ncbi:galactose oxidase [Rhizoclosmatium globosum]|uniref:Galactose oxidase n=1 Tax=Rhizoclosmatium globosum TaxID=329046 RepID=A0A1Y2BX30_9FUNG|nr:galactose oxidase [Rhizoclosmatium globosum]|eukprot:ORY39306.1 galactose oxidase [Rhizoclosmatium globosum]